MSWWQQIKTNPDASFSETLDAAVASAKQGSVSEDVRAKRDATIDAQAEFLRELGSIFDGPQYDGLLTFGGHVDSSRVDADIKVEITQAAEPAAEQGA